MHLPLRQLLIVLAFSAGLTSSFAYVMGPDDRAEVAKGQEQVDAIRQTGMIRIEGEEFVSGLLTGENCDVVISAGHAAIYWQSVDRKGWRKGELRGQGRFRFSLNPTEADDWQSMQLVAAGYELDKNVGKDEHDWSIFRLHSPGKLECKNFSVRRKLQTCRSRLLMPGFHFDRPYTKLLDQSCEVKQRKDSGIIAHNCDSKDGSSGAPLFCRDNGKLSLLAINISGLTNKGYFDSGVYGKPGRAFNDKRHKNFAISISGDFYRALVEEMKASAERRSSFE